jgi:hypothetical protein
MWNKMTGMCFKNRYGSAFFICLQTAFLCLSCAASDKSRHPEPSMTWDSQTPRQVVERLRHDQEKIIDLTASFSLSVDPPAEGQPSTLHGVIFFLKSLKGTSLRIKGLGPFGRIVFDLVQTGDDLQVYVPSRKTLYMGKKDSTVQTRNIWGDMLRTMFADYSDLKTAPKADLTFKEGMVIVPLEHGEIMINSKTGLVRKRYERDKVIFYDRYEQEPGLPPIPTHIEVRKTDSTLHAVCRLSHVRVNSQLSDVFDLSVYNPMVVRDMKELEMKRRD